MKIDVSNLPFPVSPDLVKLLNDEIRKANPGLGASMTLNFYDPNYRFEMGGFHPVEIRLNAAGQIMYMTDFAFVGVGPFAELAKEIDFDFSLSLFQHFGRDYPLKMGQELFDVFHSNFCSYYAMGIYEVEVQFD